MFNIAIEELEGRAPYASDVVYYLRKTREALVADKAIALPTIMRLIELERAVSHGR